MSKHAPGPWQSGTVTTKAGRNKVAIRCGAHHICDVSVYNDEDAANARLIAAAPDLLEALRTVVAYAAHLEPGTALDNPRNKTLRNALDVIAKAGG